MEALAKSKCFRRGDGFEWRLAGIIMPAVFFMVISPSNLYAQTHGRWLSAEPTLTFDRFSVDQGLLWIGTWGGGLNRFDPVTEQFTRYRHDPDNPGSLRHNTVFSIYEDSRSSGTLWIGTIGGGLNRFDSRTGQFSHYRHDPDNPNSLSHDAVNDICQDQTAALWIGTANGLDRFMPAALSSSGGENDDPPAIFTHFRHDPKNPQSLSKGPVSSIYLDSEGVLWAGVVGGGLDRLLKTAEEFVHYRHDPSDPHSLSDNSVEKVYEDHAGALWIGTNGGLNRFDHKQQRFEHYRHDPNDSFSLSQNSIWCITEDQGGALWVGTMSGGLNRLNRERTQFTRFQSDLNNPKSLSDNRVLSVYVDRRGVLWAGTGTAGLNKFDRATETFTHYREKDGLPNDVVYGILEDEHGNLWMSTNKGLARFNPVTGQFRNYDVSDGLQSNEFNIGAYHKSKSGEMFFGGINGFNAFYPEDINDGIWNERGAALKIIITPPYWQTWWFRAGASITILLLAFIWYRRRINRIEARKRELEIQVAERTRAAEALGNALAEVERLKNRLQAENIYLQDEIKVVHNFENIITRSAALTKVLRNVEQVASSDATVLILGESGTGKELVARAVHRISPRSNRPLVKVNCSALPANLIESELFGHEKGAYTGAVARKIGRFELADGGTIFLDEIGDLPLELQTKLLRVLQEGEFERLGDPQTVKVDVRVIAATNRDLEKERAQGNFREDLFYRLNVFPIQIPPLRERKEDLPLLLNHFVKKYSAKIGRKIESIPQEVLDRLLAYHWPGNVRELENLIERALIVSPGPKLMLGDWLPKTDSSPAATTICTLEETERHHILSALEKTNWRVSGEKGAAKILGINPKTLESRMKKLEIRRKRLTSDAVRNS